MRIDGASSHSYPIKRQPRKGKAVVDESVEDLVGEFEVSSEPAAASAARASGNRIGSLPARQQDMIYPRAHSSRTAKALASYLTTASFVDWDMEVLGLDLHI
ncbi:hypothetical protein D9M71_447090 [compost metagenome]